MPDKGRNVEKEEKWDLIISPKRGLFSLNIGELFKYRDLILLFVKRDFIANYKQTVLGPLWHILQPLLTTLTFVIIFGNVAKLSADGTPHLLFYMIGIITWTYFSSCLVKTSTTFVSNAHIFSKVYFPRLSVPVSVVISNFITFFVQFLIFIVFYLYYFFSNKYVYGFSPQYLPLLLLLVLLMAMLGLGMGIIISSLTTKYRDFSFLVGFGVQLMMYISPVIFPLSQVSGKLKYLLLCNPMTPVIETMRVICLGKGVLNGYHLAYTACFAVVTLFIGVLLFNRIEKSFNDTV
ncbi:MAG TPA: ABC transporter permease [Flavobacteriales bacterium]|nr:ABC transporter permease [Flavobacteriales bacterium]